MSSKKDVETLALESAGLSKSSMKIAASTSISSSQSCEGGPACPQRSPPSRLSTIPAYRDRNAASSSPAARLRAASASFTGNPIE